MPNPDTDMPNDASDPRPVSTRPTDEQCTAEQQLDRWLELKEQNELRAELAAHGLL